MKNIYFVLLFAVSFVACSSPNESSFEFDLSTVYNQINFKQPTIGQTSNYIRFNGSNFGAPNSSLSYSGDTLSVSLVAKSGDAYTFQERITSGSSVFNVSNSYIDGHDMLKSSDWKLEGDSLKFVSGSTFLHWIEEVAIPLVVDESTPKINLRTWGTNRDNNTNQYFAIISGQINDFNFDDLTASYTSESTNSDGFEMISNQSFGIIRSSVFNENQLNGNGWELQLGN